MLIGQSTWPLNVAYCKNIKTEKSFTGSENFQKCSRRIQTSISQWSDVDKCKSELVLSEPEIDQFQ